MGKPKVSPQSRGTDDLKSQEKPEIDKAAERTTEEQKPPEDAAAAAADMPPGGKPRPNLRREADLSSLLHPGEKTELTALVSKVTDSMLKHVTLLFDPLPVVDNADVQPSRVSFWSQLPYYLKDLSLGGPLSENRANLPDNTKPARSKKAGRARDKRNADPIVAVPPSEKVEASTPRLQELKKEALQHFRKWQMAVQRRIGDISVMKGLDPQQSSTGPSSSAYPGSRRRQSPNKRGKPGGRRPIQAVDGPDADTLAAPKVPPANPTLTFEPDPVLVQLYPPTPTGLSSLPAEKRCLLLHSLVLLFLSLEGYSAYTRVLLLNIVSSLHLPMRILAEDEVRVGRALSHLAKAIPPDLLTPRKTEDGKPFRRWKTAVASIASVVGGVAGTLAEPLAAAGIGTALGTTAGIPNKAAAGLLGTMADNALVVGALFAIYGARASGKMMEHYLKDVSDFAFIPLRGSTGPYSELGKITPESRRLRLVLGISGWLMNKTNGTTNPWHCLGDRAEVYAVRWELDALTKLGSSFDTLVRSAAWSTAKKEITARTIFSNLADGRWPATLLKISKIVDNNWNNGMVRADKLGAALADVIMGKAQGERGVSLVGYSLGARAIYACLMCLAERRAFGLIENVVMMGAPTPSDAMTWCAMKSVVSGRLVNVYSEKDYILGFLYRTSSIEFGLAGLQRVTGVDSIENVDVTAKISTHPRYQFLVGSVLRHIGWEDTDGEQIARDEAEMSFYEDRNRKHEERRNAVELGKVEVKKEGEQGIIRTRMRKKNRK